MRANSERKHPGETEEYITLEKKNEKKYYVKNRTLA